MRRLLTVVTVVALISGAVYWAQHRPVADAGAEAVSAAEAVPLEVGRIPDLPLPDADEEPLPPPALRPAFDPVVLGPCNLFPAGEQEVASPMDGVCQEVLVQLGQQVRRDQLLARLDDRQVVPQLELLRIKAESRSAERVARALYQDADAKVQYALRANQSGLKAVSDLEYKNYLFQRERYEHEMNRAREEREAAAKELDRVGAQLELHRIRSALAGEVIKIHKRDGETVKQAEPLFRIANFDRLRVEGLCKVSQATSLRVDMPALVEPELRGEPLTRLSGHTAAIHALDSSADGRWLASASEDRTVLLWSWPQGTRRGLLRHPVEVHAVRFVPDASGPRVLVSGAADGQLRRWTIGADGRAGEPLVFAAAHDGAVRSLAISTDGQLVASGGEDRRIGLWEAASGRHLYWLHEEDSSDRGAHQGAVTSVQFAAARQLVSAGRDQAVKLWLVGDGAGRVLGTQTGRTGDISVFGLARDGRLVPFDHGEELRLLRRSDWGSAGTLHSLKQGQFQNLALFAPSGRLLLAGASGGRIGLWKTPAASGQAALLRQAYAAGFDRSSLAGLGLGLAGGPTLAPLAAACLSGTAPLPRLWSGDGWEVRHFQVPGGTPLCGVFLPDESVVFTAGADRTIHAWPIPAGACAPLEGRLTFIGSQVERGTDMVRVRVELANPTTPGQRLRPGTHATLRLYPEAAGQ